MNHRPHLQGIGAAALRALAVVVVVLAGTRIVTDHRTDTTTTPAAGGLDALASLRVAPEADIAGYRRELFGSGWATGPDGCDTRTGVLVDESRTPATRTRCSVRAGEWISVYDAVTVTDPTRLDVDHLVPLAEAWASGAHAWAPERRRVFANDLDNPDALVAVTAATNRAKSDRDPTEWLPPERGVWCWYATAWVTTKAAWRLAVDDAERQALAGSLADCPTDDQGVGQ